MERYTLQWISGGQYRIKAAQHREGQHDALVLGRPVRPAQQVGYLPDEVGMLAMV